MKESYREMLGQARAVMIVKKGEEEERKGRKRKEGKRAGWKDSKKKNIPRQTNHPHAFP